MNKTKSKTRTSAPRDKLVVRQPPPLIPPFLRQLNPKYSHPWLLDEKLNGTHLNGIGQKCKHFYKEDDEMGCLIHNMSHFHEYNHHWGGKGHFSVSLRQGNFQFFWGYAFGAGKLHVYCLKNKKDHDVYGYFGEGKNGVWLLMDDTLIKYLELDKQICAIIQMEVKQFDKMLDCTFYDILCALNSPDSTKTGMLVLVLLFRILLIIC